MPDWNIDSPMHPAGVRLVLRPVTARSGALLDGGWWPRSRDPSEELRLLVPALNERGGPVRGLSLSIAGWDTHPDRLRVDMSAITLHWLGLYRDLAIVTWCDGGRLELMVLPADCESSIAVAAMAMTLAPSNQTPSPAIIARAASAAGPRPAPRWGSVSPGNRPHTAARRPLLAGTGTPNVMALHTASPDRRATHPWVRPVPAVTSTPHNDRAAVNAA